MSNSSTLVTQSKREKRRARLRAVKEQRAEESALLDQELKKQQDEIKIQEEKNLRRDKLKELNDSYIKTLASIKEDVTNKKEKRDKIAKLQETYNKNLEMINSGDLTNLINVSTAENSNTQEKPAVSQASKQELTIDDVIKKYDTMWDVVKKHVKANPDFKESEDKKKLDFFRRIFPTEMEEQPIVTRYMICLGQYRAKALRRMLDKIKSKVHPPPEKREKNYMEDQWVQRQADYVQYLWEEYQTKHYNNAERKWVYQEAYNRLKGEFDDFRDMHKEVEKKIEEEKKTLQGRNVRDLLMRLKTGKQQLSPEDQEYLREELRNALIRSNMRVVLKQLKKTREEIPAVCSGHGMAEDVDERKRQITVIENGVLQPDQNVSDVPDAAAPKPEGFVNPDVYDANAGDNISNTVHQKLDTIAEQPDEYVAPAREDNLA